GFTVEECSGRPRLLFAGVPDAAPGEFGEFEDAADWPDEDWDEEDDEEESEEPEEEDGEHWAVELGHPWELPLGDLDLWERHGLPWAADRLAPVARFFARGGVERPDTRQLAFLEGLLRAMGRMTEEKLDAGRWEEEVPTFQGPLRFVLSLPGLPSAAELEELAAPADGPPEERVAKLMARARWATGREAVQLARRALEIWPDCAEAWVRLAERAPDVESARRLFAAGLAAAERTLGPEARSAAGPFWERDEARPYLWALFGLAEALAGLGRKEEAATYFQELLCLDPDDHAGARHSFVTLLLELGRDDEADEELAQSPHPFSDVIYLRALVAFRREGDSAEARRRLREALQVNRAFPLLLGGNLVPRLVAGEPVLGAAEDTAAWFSRYQAPWRDTPGALEWLAERSGLAKGKNM
ncbi:MAG TPA: hypothetical protein VFC23_16465, partial [Thermoanaerobaculia bacterium]|nr:hypothetical protein [Thermoanaerobaculia bacterium]